MATAIQVNIERALATPDLRWPFKEELEWLAEQAVTRKKIVEVGCYLGRSTIAMAANTQGTVHAIDDWYGPRDSDTKDEDRPGLLDQFMRNVEGLPVVVHKCDHSSPPTISDCDMVFIDGSHEYAAVRRDILLWKSRLALGGLLCGHDRNMPKVRRALDDVLPGWNLALGHSTIWYWTEEV
jgi:hypothetical protein